MTYAYLVVRDKNNLPQVVMHRGHGVRTLVKHEVHFSFHLLSIWYSSDHFLNNLYIDFLN